MYAKTQKRSFYPSGAEMTAVLPQLLDEFEDSNVDDVSSYLKLAISKMATILVMKAKTNILLYITMVKITHKEPNRTIKALKHNYNPFTGLLNSH